MVLLDSVNSCPTENGFSFFLLKNPTVNLYQMASDQAI